eukprot:scaffold318803_cov18-Tisochrysis_lutea.AAC.1
MDLKYKRMSGSVRHPSSSKVLGQMLSSTSVTLSFQRWESLCLIPVLKPFFLGKEKKGYIAVPAH